MSRIEHFSDAPQWCARIRALAQAGYSAVQITACLAREGFRSPKQAKPFSRQSVVELMQRFAVPHPHRRRRLPLRTHAWWLSDLTRAVGVSPSTLHRWRQYGWLQARWHPHCKRWVAWADEAEMQRLPQRGVLPTGYGSHHMWLEAQPSQPTVSSHFPNVSSHRRRSVMRHAHTKECLDNSMMVDTSNGHWPGFPNVVDG